MKTLTQEQEEAIKKIEQEGDACFEKQTFDYCLSALDKYVTAQMELYKAANDDNIENVKPYPFFNSDNVSYKSWYVSLTNKMSKVNAAMANPKIARK